MNNPNFLNIYIPALLQNLGGNCCVVFLRKNVIGGRFTLSLGFSNTSRLVENPEKPISGLDLYSRSRSNYNGVIIDDGYSLYYKTYSSEQQITTLLTLLNPKFITVPDNETVLVFLDKKKYYPEISEFWSDNDTDESYDGCPLLILNDFLVPQSYERKQLTIFEH